MSYYVELFIKNYQISLAFFVLQPIVWQIYAMDRQNLTDPLILFEEITGEISPRRMAVSRITNKKARLIKAQNQFEVNDRTAPEFMLSYQKIVLLTLKEQGTINDLQYQVCLEGLLEQTKKSTK